jgi:hypothetical protein
MVLDRNLQIGKNCLWRTQLSIIPIAIDIFGESVSYSDAD